jgi:recombination protein RecA
MAKEKKEVVSNVGLTKVEALERARIEIEKSFGQNALIKLDGSNIEKVPMQSTGILGLDDILGGGIGIGRITEIYGPESAGKTTLALHAIAQTQKDGGIVAYIDTEQAFDSLYAKNIGVDINNLWFSQPDCGEQALDIMDKLISSGSISTIVIDSTAALTPRAELEGEMGDSHMGLQARLLSQGLRKVVSKAGKTKTSLIFISQLRSKIGVVYGSNEVVGVGNALKFYTSQRIDIRKIETKEEGEEAIANKVRVTVRKNKLAPPFRKREFMIYFGKGIDKYEDVLSLAIEKEIIQKAGAWYSYNTEKIGQGATNASDFLRGNEAIFNEVVEKLKSK